MSFLLNPFILQQAASGVFSGPVFVSKGAGAASTGQIFVPLPVGWQPYDILILVVTRPAVLGSPPTGWTLVPDSNQSFPAAVTDNLAVYWKRATESEHPVVIANNNDHNLAFIAAFRDASRASDPWDVTAGDSTTSAGTSVVWPDDTTTVTDCLILLSAAHTAADGFNDDAVNSNLDNLTRLGQATTTSGTDGSIALWSGELAAAGPIGVTTATAVSSVNQAHHVAALKPLAIGVPAQFTTGNWQVYDLGSSGEVMLAIARVPSDEGSALTDIEYQLDGGSWFSLGATVPDEYTISGLTDDQEYDVAIRAVNSIGAGPASATKAVTPTGDGLDDFRATCQFLAPFNGTNGATTAPDESLSNRTITFGGSAAITTAQSKFGGSSLRIPGFPSGLDIANSTAWVFGLLDFNIEAFVRFNSVTALQTLISKWTTSFPRRAWTVRYTGSTTTKLQFRYSTSGADDLLAAEATWAPATNTWYHVRVDRKSGVLRIYVDGVMLASAAFAVSLIDASAGLRIGQDQGNHFDGWMQQVRVDRGMALCGDDAGYTVPTVPYPLIGYAPPTYLSVNAIAAITTGDLSLTLPASVAENDLLLMFVETANEDISPPSGWAQLQDSPVSATGGSTTTRLSVFWRRAGASEPSPVLPDAGDHTVAMIVAFRNGVIVGDPWDVVASDTDLAVNGANIVYPGVTTTHPGCLIVNALSYGIDSAASGWGTSLANPDIVDLTQRINVGSSIGNGGGFIVFSGNKRDPNPGAVAGTTGTFGSTSDMAYLTFALKGRIR